MNFIEWLEALFRSIFASTPILPPEPIIPPTPPEQPVTPNPAPIPPVVPPAPTPHVSKIDIWCEAAKIMENARPELNNPGNIRYIGQKDAINNHGFAQWPTYAIGYQHLKNLFIAACTGTSSYYHPGMTLYEFYAVYAPSSDGNNPKAYAEFVAKHIGVSPTVQIKTLL